MRQSHIGLLVTLALFSLTSVDAMDLQLTGKTALVTGSTSNIGYAIAETLLRDGAAVIINGRSAESVGQAAESLARSTGKKPLGFVGDMSRPEDIERLLKTHPGVDILINNVATFIMRPFEQSDDSVWNDSWNLNVMSGVRLARGYLPRMRQQNWGRIIFISSESAYQIPVEAVAYGVSKSAQIAVARGIAESVAGSGITVNSVMPGPTATADSDMIASLAKQFGTQDFKEIERLFFERMRPTSLTRRFARPDEVASLVVYLASPRASATTGAALRVDGGIVKSAY